MIDVSVLLLVKAGVLPMLWVDGQLRRAQYDNTVRMGSHGF